MSPMPISRVTEIGAGVSKVGMAILLGALPSPAGVALAALGVARIPRAGQIGPIDRGRGGTHDPGVDGQALGARGLLDAGLQLVGEADVDPRRGSLVAFAGGLC